MRIVASKLALHGGASAAPVGAVRSRTTERYGVLLTLTDEGGRAGQGEASPLPGHSRDTLDDVVDALRDVHERLGGRELRSWTDLEDVGGALALPPSARFAFETAALDLLAQRKRFAVHELFPGASPGREVAVSAYVGAALDAGLLDATRAALARGVRAVKVKLSGADDVFERELAALVGLRAEAGAGFELRLDANGAWGVDEARRKLEGCAAVGPSFVEQPVAPGLLHTLGRCAVPWAADESLGDPGDRRALLARAADGCVAVVVKPAIHGFVAARELAEAASSAGLGVVVTHLFDGPVALAAACELALSLRAPPLACGLDLHPGLAAWAPITVLQRASPATVRRSGRAGLGLLPLP